jgi:hypothetical protein
VLKIGEGVRSGKWVYSDLEVIADPFAEPSLGWVV